MIDWPTDLVEDIARRRCVLFLGAGVSKNAANERGERPMDWSEFLAHLSALVQDQHAREAINGCIQKDDLLTACEIARTSLQRQNFNTQLMACFLEKRFQPAEIHQNLVGIDSRVVLTTNIDKLYETSAISILHGDIIVKSHIDDIGDVIRRKNRCVIKVHGTIDRPEDTIFTRMDYASARTKYANFYRVIDALFMTHTFVFLGASMRDPDMALLLEDYARRHQGARPHYVVMPRNAMPSHVLKVLEESMKLQVIHYEPAEFHRELGEGILELKNQVDVAREGLLKTMNW